MALNAIYTRDNSRYNGPFLDTSTITIILVQRVNNPTNTRKAAKGVIKKKAFTLHFLNENFGVELSATDDLPPTKKQTVSKLYPGSANKDDVALSLLRRKGIRS